MTVRRGSRQLRFIDLSHLKDVGRRLPAGDYQVVTDEEVIEGLSFTACHRISTVIFVPPEAGCAVEMVLLTQWTFRRRTNKTSQCLPCTPWWESRRTLLSPRIGAVDVARRKITRQGGIKWAAKVSNGLVIVACGAQPNQSPVTANGHRWLRLKNSRLQLSGGSLK